MKRWEMRQETFERVWRAGVAACAAPPMLWEWEDGHREMVGCRDELSDALGGLPADHPARLLITHAIALYGGWLTQHPTHPPRKIHQSGDMSDAVRDWEYRVKPELRAVWTRLEPMLRELGPAARD